MIGRWAERLTKASDRRTVAFGLVGASVAVSSFLRTLLRTLTGLFLPPPFGMTFIPAILFSTVVAGARGGVLAIVLSFAAELFLFSPPSPAGPFAGRGAASILFAVIALLLVAMTRILRLGAQRGAAAAQQFRVALEGARDPFVILEPVSRGGRIVDFRWLYANPAAERTTPASLGGLVGRRVREVFAGQEGEAMFARLMEAMDPAPQAEKEVKVTIGGEVRWMRNAGVRLDHGVAITYRDVTEQRAAEEALRQGEAQIRVLINALPQLLWSSPNRGEVDFFSPQWNRYTGLPAEQLYGMDWLEVVHPEDHPRVESVWRSLQAGVPPPDLEYRIRRHDGVWRWFSGRVTSVRDPSGAVLRWYGSATDITEIVEARQNLEERVAERTRALEASLEERARAEASLAQAQRLETVGRLTGGVAHDFNNLLTVIIGGLDMILRKPDDAARVTRLGEAALAAGQRGERLTRQLLAFARRQELKLEVTDVAALILQIEPLVRRAIGEALELSVFCESELGHSRLDAAQFEAALLNLVVNAADATPAGGEIRIEAARVRLGAGDRSGAAPGDYVRISVSDTGAGMPREVLERVYEPFFTTKEVGKGTGLGLAQVFGFVTQCGGTVVIDSVVGEGTTVRLRLPLASGVADAPAGGELSRPAPWAAGVRVLLVEDDEAVREVTEALLVEMGFAVTCEAGGPPALERLQSGEAFDLVLSDIVMPGAMSGFDLARAASALRPDLPIVLATGYAGERAEATEAMDWPVLRKPFNADQLAEALHRVLRPGEAGSLPSSDAA